MVGGAEAGDVSMSFIISERAVRAGVAMKAQPGCMVVVVALVLCDTCVAYRGVAAVVKLCPQDMRAARSGDRRGIDVCVSSTEAALE